MFKNVGWGGGSSESHEPPLDPPLWLPQYHWTNFNQASQEFRGWPLIRLNIYTPRGAAYRFNETFKIFPETGGQNSN